jgi:beta-galactosidase
MGPFHLCSFKRLRGDGREGWRGISVAFRKPAIRDSPLRSRELTLDSPSSIFEENSSVTMAFRGNSSPGSGKPSTGLPLLPLENAEGIMWRFLIPAALLLVCRSSATTPREITRLDSSWRFHLGEVQEASLPDFDDHEWQTVNLPHCWGWEEAQQGHTYYRGPGWYRRSLDIDGPKPGRRYYLRCEAAGSVADVYLNGTFLGQHRGAFGAFCFEITAALSSDGKNELALRVSNAPEPDLAPLSGDFCVFGGLYRSVSLIETGESSFALTDHASPGVAWYQTAISDSQAVLDITAEISSASARNEELNLVALIQDASGLCLASVEKPISAIPRAMVPERVRLVLGHPHLWNGREDPFLYRAVVELRRKDGTLRDLVEQPLGLRFYRVDPQKGFFLNGRAYHLHGVNRHQDRWNQGWALSRDDMREDLALIKEIGCTAVRCAHYQQSNEFYNLCDSSGILVWAELPQVDEIGTTAQFAETSRQQMLDLIRQNVNHPSIFVWSLFNELWPGRSDPHRELLDLNIVAHGEDPSRPTIAATATDQLPQMNKIPDWLGWNIYPGWYPGWGPKESFASLLDKGRTMSRSGGLCVSEYGAGANTEQHEESPQQPRTDGQWHPEEWQALVHEAAWKALRSRSFIWGSFVWVMFDFTSASRHEGGVAGRNDKGLVTGDRKTKKDAFFFYKANWSDAPTLYIASRRFTERTNPAATVKVYASTPEVELLVNGTSQGRRAPGEEHIARWMEIRLRPGENRIEARGEWNGHPVSDACIWRLTSQGNPTSHGD